MDTNQDYLEKKILLYRLQKKILFQSLHDMQSPLSAVSGYLELLQICLKGDKDLTKIERYRRNLQFGFDEVNHIVEQIRYIENKTVEDEEGGKYDVSLSWFLRDLCLHATSFAENKEQKVVYVESKSECYLRKNIPLLRLFLYNTILILLKYMPKGKTIQLSNENVETGVAITCTVQECIRSASEIRDIILADQNRSSSQSVEGIVNQDLPAMEQAMKVLHCSFSSESLRDKGVLIRVLFTGDSISFMNPSAV